VGPSGQCHCRPAPHPGWLPWAALSRCTPRGYLDAAIRCRLASPLTPPRQRGSEANRLAAVSEADRVAARGLKPCATAAVPASKRRPHTTSARLSRCQLAVAYSFLPGHHRSPCWCRSPPLFLGGRWSSGCRSSRQAAVLHRHRACSRWARVTGECRTALSSAVGRLCHLRVMSHHRAVVPVRSPGLCARATSHAGQRACRAHGPRPTRPWAVCAVQAGPCNTVQTGCVGTVAVGCALLCHWATADSAQWHLIYFSIF
jgi:hypothetical protein